MLVNVSVFLLLGFEVNFMDDVGQTLLNWASAFGTQEMVRDSSEIVSAEMCSFVSLESSLLAALTCVNLSGGVSV